MEVSKAREKKKLYMYVDNAKILSICATCCHVRLVVRGKKKGIDSYTAVPG